MKTELRNGVRLDINIFRSLGGILTIIAGVILYFRNRKAKNNKYISLAGILTTLFGCALIGTELENSFKPVDVEEVTDEDLDE